MNQDKLLELWSLLQILDLFSFVPKNEEEIEGDIKNRLIFSQDEKDAILTLSCAISDCIHDGGITKKSKV